MAVWFDTAQKLELTLQAAFGDNPLVASPTWTDISGYMRTIKTRRGKSSSIGRVSPGTMSVLLSNADGRFDPTFTGGAYNPNVKPNVQIRLLANYNATGDVVLFRGFTAGWRLGFPGMTDATALMRVIDGYKIMNLVNSDTLETSETTNVRMGNLLDYASWPAGWRALGTGGITVSDLQTSCKSILAAIRTIEDAEGGWFFFAANGDATFQTRSYRSGLAVSATFGDAATEVPYNTIEIDTDETEIRNTVAVSRIGGVTQTVTDATSIAAHTIMTLKKLDLPVMDDAAALTLANLYLARYKDGNQGINAVNVIPLADASTAWTHVVNRELGDKVTVKRRPTYGTFSQDMHIEGIAHTISVKKQKWHTKYNLSQVS